MTEMSSGTLKPFSWKTETASMAMSSDETKTAVGLSDKANILSAATRADLRE